MRYELSDNEVTAIKPMLPNKPHGVPRVNHRGCGLGVGISLIAAKDGRLRSSSGPDSSETHGLQCRRLRTRSDELVFENACVRASSRDTADQQIGTRRRAERGEPC